MGKGIGRGEGEGGERDVGGGLVRCKQGGGLDWFLSDALSIMRPSSVKYDFLVYSDFLTDTLLWNGFDRSSFWSLDRFRGCWSRCHRLFRFSVIFSRWSVKYCLGRRKITTVYLDENGHSSHTIVIFSCDAPLKCSTNIRENPIRRNSLRCGSTGRMTRLETQGPFLSRITSRQVTIMPEWTSSISSIECDSIDSAY